MYKILPSADDEKLVLFVLTLNFVKLLQPENAEPPIVVTLSGIVMFVKLLQPENTSLPIVVTLSGIVTLVKLLQL